MDATPFQEQIGNQYDVLIQGAGIGGLTLAIALQQRGYGVRIVERSAGLSEVGAGIWMAANPMQVFDRLGLAGKILDAGWIVKFIHLLDAKSGEIQTTDMSAIAKQFGFETVALHRAVLQRILFEHLVPGTVSFSCEVQSFAQRSRLRLCRALRWFFLPVNRPCWSGWDQLSNPKTSKTWRG